MNNKVTIGILIWGGLIGASLIAIRQLPEASTRGLTQLFQFAVNQRYSAEIRFANQLPLAVGDLIFLDDNHDYTPVGYVSRVGASPTRFGAAEWSNVAKVTFYANAPSIQEGDFLTYHQPPDDLGWVIQTMLPPEKRTQITESIIRAYLDEGPQIAEALRPIVSSSLADATEIIGRDVKLAFERRHDQFNAIGKRYQKEVVENQIVPLIKEEIWPIMQEEGEGLANQIGQEIWKEVSVFRFAWRYLYDQSGIPEKSLTKEELNRFLESKVVPIIESHLPDILEVQNRVVARVSRSERTQQTFYDAISTVANDAEIRDIIGEIFQEVMLDNQTLRDSLVENWNSPQAKQAISYLSQRIEPTVSEIGVILFGTPDGEITPEFARVLRHRILQKDRRWFTLELAETPHESAISKKMVGYPQEIPVKIADPAGRIPYAPARER